MHRLLPLEPLAGWKLRRTMVKARKLLNREWPLFYLRLPLLTLPLIPLALADLAPPGGINLGPVLAALPLARLGLPLPGPVRLHLLCLKPITSKKWLGTHTVQILGLGPTAMGAFGKAGISQTPISTDALVVTCELSRRTSLRPLKVLSHLFRRPLRRLSRLKALCHLLVLPLPFQERLVVMAAMYGVESGSGNELTPTPRERSAYEFRERAKALYGQADVLNQEDYEGRDHFMEEEQSEDELIRADTSGAPLGHSLRQASDLAAAEAPIAAAEAPLAGDAPAASDAAIASASRVQSAIPSEISDFKSCASAVSMPAQG